MSFEDDKLEALYVYFKLKDILKPAADDMLRIVLDPNSTDDERSIAENLLYEILFPYTVVCQFCHEEVPANTAHLHGKEWVGDECCWDERLRSSE